MAEEESMVKTIENLSDLEGKCPPGYERIIMSTGGLYGAPNVLHIRNFSVEEALQLGMVSQEDLPIKIVSLLQNIIFEENVKVANFYDGEVAELMIKFYKTFYQSIMRDVKYDITKKDAEWAKETIFKGQDSPEYRNWIRGCKIGKIPLTYDIDLNQVKYYDVGDKAHDLIKATKNGFEFIFQYPRFGDAAILQKAVKEEFRAEDRQFGPLYETYRRKRDMEDALRRGEDVDPANIPYIEPDDLNAVRAYETKKTSYIISQMKGMYLHSIGGKDVSQLPLSERIEIAKDSRYDFSLYQMISEKLNKMEVGPIPKITIINPITHAVEEVDHPFRTLDLLAAIKNYRSDNTVIESI